MVRHPGAAIAALIRFACLSTWLQAHARATHCARCSTIASLVVATAEDAARALNDCGVAVIRDVFTPDELHDVRKGAEAHLDRPDAGSWKLNATWFDRVLTNPPRTEWLLPFTAPFNEPAFFQRGALAATLNLYFRLVGEQRAWLEHAFLVRAHANRSVAQPPHRDHSAVPGVVVQVPLGVVLVTHGPTVVFPCSALAERPPAVARLGGLSFTIGPDGLAPLGSVLLYTTATKHFGAANTHATHDRDVLFFSYCRFGAMEPRPPVDLVAVHDQAAWRAHVWHADSPSGAFEVGLPESGGASSETPERRPWAEL